jgi:hypothetical protein
MEQMNHLWRTGILLGLGAVAVSAVWLLTAPLRAQKLAPVGRWDLLVLDGDPPAGAWLDSLAVGDIDGDGQTEIVTGGENALLWHRPATRERGVIARGTFAVGIAVEDLDGDRVHEVVTGRKIDTNSSEEQYRLSWFKRGKRADEPWAERVVDSLTAGHPHDILFADLDGDGRRDLVANAMYSRTPGLFIYKHPGDPAQPWLKHAVQTGFFAEGTAAGDLNGDGRRDIVSGPYWYQAPASGPFSGGWTQRQIAGFREMCRAAVIDINGDRRQDVVLVESEYPDGRMSWFENRVAVDRKEPWAEHPMERPLNYAHSLRAWRDHSSAPARVFVAEMAKGGWDAPYNWDARLLKYDFAPDGTTWTRELIYQGAGSHEATVTDVDGDGILEVVGKEEGRPKVQIWKQVPPSAPALAFQHRLLDREKPYTATDILTGDVDGDGLKDVICGSWWYRNPTWERIEFPGVYQVVTAFDLDRDGRLEFIATRKEPGQTNWYGALSSELCWLKAIDPLRQKWEEHTIGSGSGDWPHATAVAPLLPGGGLALVVGYHNADESHPPEIFLAPEDPKVSPWNKRILAPIPYGEEIVPADLDGDGKLDLVAGPYWVENLGDGRFEPHLLAEGFGKTSRVRVADLNGDGRPDIAVAEEDLSYDKRESFFARVAWLENTGDPRSTRFAVHVVDRVRSPHSLDVADFDHDGQPELIVGEHDPFKPYRSRSRLYLYKKADRRGTAWYRYVVDDRFEHHDGAKVFEVSRGRIGIVSHGWADSRYVHLWEQR